MCSVAENYRKKAAIYLFVAFSYKPPIMCNRLNIKKGNWYIMRHMTKESMTINQSSEIAHKSKKDELKSTLSGKICYSNSDMFEPRSHFVSTLTMIVRVSVVSSQRPSTLKMKYRTGCRNVSDYQHQSYAGLRSPGRSCLTYLIMLFSHAASTIKRRGLYRFLIDE